MEDSGTIRIQGLAKRYHSGASDLCVFSDLSLEIWRGERVALTGESGAGKSTLLYLMGGLDRPSSGTIQLNGKDLGALDGDGLAEARNRWIGFVWQSQTLLAEFTALENVMMPLMIRGTGRTEAGRVAAEKLREVGLSSRAHHLGGELSGGEQQRAVLARALAGKPQFLFADEPTGNLDSRNGGMIMDLLEEVHQTNGLTTVYVTHNPEFAGRAGRILRLEQGLLKEGVAIPRIRIPQDKERYV